MADSSRLHNIVIEWSYPTKLVDIDTHWDCNENGLYYISRKFGGVESPIYIGETKRDFITRINEHYKKISDFFDKRGEKYIRLGKIVKPQSLTNYNEVEFKHLLQTIESILVEDLYLNGLGNHLCNIRQTNSYTEWFKLNIENTRYRGGLSRYIPYNEE